LPNYYQEHRIWLEENVCEALNDFVEKLSKIIRDFNVSGMDRRPVKEWQKSWEAVQQDIPQLRKRIETYFRSLLGVNAVPDNS